MRLALVILFTSMLSSSIAQPVFYERTYGLGRGVFIDKALNGNYIIGANTGTFPSYQAYYFLVDSNYDTVRTFSYPNSSLNCIRQTNDSGFIFIGDYGGSVIRNVKVVKTDSVGNSTWIQSYTSTEWGTWGTCVIPNHDNGYAIGYVDDGDLWENLFYIVKADSMGQTIDTTSVNPSAGFLLNANCIKLTDDSGVIAVSTLILSESISLAKLDSANNLQWSKLYYDQATVYGYYGSSIIQTNDGGYLFVGYKDSLAAGSIPVFGYILKTDSNGDSLWSKSYYFPGYSIQYFDVVEDSLGQFYITGQYRNRVIPSEYSTILMKTDSAGDSLWTQYFSGYSVASPNSMILDDQGLPMIIGYTEDTISQQYYIHLISADSTGNIYTSTSTTDKTSKLLTAYPNPFKNTISLHGLVSANRIFQLQILDLHGRIVYETKTSLSSDIDLHFLNNGVYLLRLNCSNTVLNCKLIKQ